MDFQKLKKFPVKIYEDWIEDLRDLKRPFVLTELFLRNANENKEDMVLHIWPMTKCVILGMLDRELPEIEKAKDYLRSQGYEVVVRNQGGLAVVADEGVLNFSFIVANALEENISMPHAYLMMVDLVREMFSDFFGRIDYFEMEESYCPGAYDLSIAGKKFAGIAQRRIKDGIAVSIYISVNGNQQTRSNLLKEFYKIGKNGQETIIKYPNIDPDCMESLDILLGEELTMEKMIEIIYNKLELLGFKVDKMSFDGSLQEKYDILYKKYK
ncbi:MULTISPECIES: lipoate--protein ligase family protein [unclassified Gemella]|uniref:lipoate--protein ligase family protein n=1 Tax=unclassified Gemella TaxID=2624949 RepID=UPI0010734F8A|nr:MULTISPECIES: lipoate--protein ligase family protein [unclassified Gemella]MBF0710333.1 lipoate--protein ligase family protein [Gemella sp. GL1.1]MBF0747009.1 lipoate--protein ligase family protein [Gemella sp. 19428wG2_WT2a]NYS27677.1 lipoate--protein ligase family protein [Gemella sp. GL1]TFU58825.1 lipoate--protein ligase family protein [Gemella sp. WT2a]